MRDAAFNGGALARSDADDSIAIQMAINTGRHVLFPDGDPAQLGAAPIATAATTPPLANSTPTSANSTSPTTYSRAAPPNTA